MMNEKIIEALECGLRELGLSVKPIQLKQLVGYMEGILLWNEKINLTAITDPMEFIGKHFLDSLVCHDFPQMKEAENIIDVGTGAGFPGVPLAIFFPDKKFILMDSLQKRLRIIDELCRELGITNVTTLHGRAEDLARTKEHREAYDLCVARAVANLAVLGEYTLPFLRVGASLLAYKGPESGKEISQGMEAITLLGGELLEEKKVVVPGMDASHVILLIKKIKRTPKQYPRKPGIPSKEPLK